MRCAAPTPTANWPAGSAATVAPTTNCAAARFREQSSRNPGQERTRIACAIRLPLLLTRCSDLDLDGQDHYDPKQEPTMVLHRFLLSQTASRTLLGAVAVFKPSLFPICVPAQGKALNRSRLTPAVPVGLDPPPCCLLLQYPRLAQTGEVRRFAQSADLRLELPISPQRPQPGRNASSNRLHRAGGGSTARSFRSRRSITRLPSSCCAERADRLHRSTSPARQLCHCHIRDDLERPFPFGVVEDVCRHHQFVGAGPADEVLQAAANRIWPADDCAAERIVEDEPGVRIKLRLEVLDRRRHSAAPPHPVVERGLLQRREQEPRLLVRFRSDDNHAEHDIGSGELF